MAAQFGEYDNYSDVELVEYVLRLAKKAHPVSGSRPIELSKFLAGRYSRAVEELDRRINHS